METYGEWSSLSYEKVENWDNRNKFLKKGRKRKMDMVESYII
jgi:hypothetical protein